MIQKAAIKYYKFMKYVRIWNKVKIFQKVFKNKGSSKYAK
jgi:hypothetical protein